jgi:uncharacterized membrane protein
MHPLVVTNAVISSFFGWVITSALFFAVDVLARKNLATLWLRLILLGVFLLSTAFWVLIAVQSVQSVQSVQPAHSLHRVVQPRRATADL